MAQGTPLGRSPSPSWSPGRRAGRPRLRCWKERLAEKDAARGAIFDGYPARSAQAKSLDALLKDAGGKVDVVLFIDVPDATLVDRLLKRAASRDAPTTPETIAGACAFTAEDRSARRPHRQAGLLVTIDGDRSVGPSRLTWPPRSECSHPFERGRMITCKGKSEILKMERAARILHETLAECVAACKPGRTTEEIGRVALPASPRAAPRLPSRAIAAIPRRFASRSTTRSCTASPRRRASSSRVTSWVSTSGPSSTVTTRTRPGPSLSIRSPPRSRN